MSGYTLPFSHIFQSTIKDFWKSEKWNQFHKSPIVYNWIYFFRFILWDPFCTPHPRLVTWSMLVELLDFKTMCLLYMARHCTVRLFMLDRPVSLNLKWGIIWCDNSMNIEKIDWNYFSKKLIKGGFKNQTKYLVCVFFSSCFVHNLHPAYFYFSMCIVIHTW